MKEVIIKLNSDHIKVKGAEYVQELVRCKECKKRGTWKCPRRGSDDDDFCSYGEE